MTQENILVSPTLSACLKPGVSAPAFRPSDPGGTHLLSADLPRPALLLLSTQQLCAKRTSVHPYWRELSTPPRLITAAFGRSCDTSTISSVARACTHAHRPLSPFPSFASVRSIGSVAKMLPFPSHVPDLLRFIAIYRNLSPFIAQLTPLDLRSPFRCPKHCSSGLESPFCIPGFPFRLHFELCTAFHHQTRVFPMQNEFFHLRWRLNSDDFEPRMTKRRLKQKS